MSISDTTTVLYFLAICIALLCIILLWILERRSNKKMVSLQEELEKSQKELSESKEELANIMEAAARRSRPTMQDVLEKQLEKSDKEDVKSAFIASMSHNLCTPIHSIIGCANIAEKYIEDQDRVGDCLCKIKETSEKLMKMVNDVLDVNRLQSGHMILQAKSQKLQDIVKASVTSFQEVAAGKGISLNVTLPKEAPSPVLVDEAQMVHMLGIVVGNALNYTQPGGDVHVSLSVLEDRSDSTFFALQVKDSGAGISPELQTRIFDPFVRDEKNVSAKGLGLGLTTARYLARLMSGDITVSSKKNEGSVFTITVRLAKVYEASETVVPVEKMKENRRVLLAEDNILHAKMATDVLEEFGLAVDHALDGQQALDMLLGAVPGTYAMVFLDIKMPVMDGYEAARQIRKSNREDLEKIPVVALTGEVLESDVQKALNAGMNAHVAKPINRDYLRKVVRQYIA